MADPAKNKKTIKVTTLETTSKAKKPKVIPPRTKPAEPVATKATPINANPSSFWRIIESPKFAKSYAIFAVIALLATTTFWALLSARLQQNNSDQLVNSYLFESSQTFHGASLPGAHSFLLKWPIFWLVHAFGNTANSFIVFTVIVTLLTVAGLALAMHRIVRRPLVFGTLCLALASCLLLVPAMPYAGGLLPVNMAMLATRNLEYIIYLACLILLAKAGDLKTKRYWLAVALLSVLIASDKLFLSLSLGGAVMALIVYALINRWDYVKLSVNWLTASLSGGILAAVWLWLINNDGVVRIAGQSTATPYSPVSGVHNFVLASVYGILGTLTNFGANPVFDSSVLRDIPNHIADRLTGYGGLGFMVNLVVLAVGGLVAWKLFRSSLKRSSNTNQPSKSFKLSLMLIWSSVAALLAFVLTNHYYSADARYLTIVLFAVFISMAAYLRQKTDIKKPHYLLAAGVVLVASIILSLIFTGKSYNTNRLAYADLNQRDQLIAEAVSRHPVASLAGDYWRVLPIKLAAKGNLKVTPLSSCFQARQALTSSTWQTMFNGRSFAYLLSLDDSLTDYQSCSLNDVIDHYGRPNSSVLIDGSLSKPKELLLFYDRGAHKSTPKTVTKTPSTVLPISLDELPYTSCSVPTIMNIVAHEDDDLLFMSPDLIHDVSAGHCIRSIYITAGDAGSSGQLYWLSRQQGSEAAYSVMAGLHDIWIERIVRLNDHEFITVANPRGNSKISLIFMHLPDGGLKGQGFASTNYQVLGHLASGSLNSISAVDNQSKYTSDQLTGALTSLMHLYQPSEIRTQSTLAGGKSHDHNDHNTVGGYAAKAYAQYEQQQFEGRVTVPIKFYMGYTVRDLPANVSGGDLQAKLSAFLVYSQHDGGVCRSDSQCRNDPAYGFYLPRQYQNNF